MADRSSSGTSEDENVNTPGGWDEEEYDDAMLDEMDDDLTLGSANLRSSLKIIRDPTKNAFDVLPSGETLGSFANRHAIDRYARKVESKRERARETRLKKRKQVKTLLRRQERATPVYGNIGGSCLSREIANGIGTHGF